jgi:hypothetical protein
MIIPSLSKLPLMDLAASGTRCWLSGRKLSRHPTVDHRKRPTPIPHVYLMYRENALSGITNVYRGCEIEHSPIPSSIKDCGMSCRRKTPSTRDESRECRSPRGQNVGSSFRRINIILWVSNVLSPLALLLSSSISRISPGFKGPISVLTLAQITMPS